MKYFRLNHLMLYGITAVFLAIAAHLLFPHFHWVQQNLHASVEALGVAFAFFLAILLLRISKYGGIRPFYVWTICAFISMGLLDLLHSFTDPGELFVWFHSIATLTGGLLFAMVWLPEHALPERYSYVLPRAVFIASCALGLVAGVFPDSIPRMLLNDGRFTTVARLINISGGLCFGGASIWFFREYIKNRTIDEILFAFNCLFFGIAGLLFNFSELWDLGWWLWHFVRIGAYAIAVFYVFNVYKELTEKIKQDHDDLEMRVKERTADLTRINETLSLEIAERKRAEAELASERKRLFSVLENLPAFVYLQARDHTIRFANSYFKDHFGDPKGKLCYEGLWGRKSPCDICPTFQVFDTGEFQVWEWDKSPDGRIYQIYDYPFIDIDGSALVLELGIDITERKEAETRLQKEKETLQKYLDISAAIVVIIDARQTVTLINKKGCEILGCRKEEILGKNWFDNFLPERLRDGIKLVHSKLMAGDIDPVEYYENEVLTKDGSERVIAWYNTVLRDEAGNITATLATGGDITGQKKAEKQIAEALKEKEVLLQEIHHRVKNNMTVISSLLRLQSYKITEKKYKVIFDDSINRIRTMALIHEKLYRSRDLAKIVFGDYLEDMVDDMFMSYGLHARNVALIKDIDKVTLGLDASIPCGLIINELLSNALKHAFSGGRGGEVRVAFHLNDKDEIELTISDNGVGMPEGMDFRDTDSLGLNLVTTLVKQLQGKIELRGDRGTEFRVTFMRR